MTGVEQSLSNAQHISLTTWVKVIWAIVFGSFAAPAGTALLAEIKKRWRRRRWQMDVVADPPAQVTPHHCDECPDTQDVGERLRHLYALRDRVRASGDRARFDGTDIHTARERHHKIELELRNMRFLSQHAVLLENRFALHHPLSESGVSQTWQGYDSQADRYVALKFRGIPYDTDSPEARRFGYGARYAHHFGRAVENYNQPLPFYIVDLEPGESLDRHVCREFTPLRRLEQRLTFSHDLLKRVMELGRTIAAAHDQGIVHRDIHPGNIIITPKGSMQLVEFDSARTVLELQGPQSGVGTIGFAAPEVLQGRASQACCADVFSLGRVLVFIHQGRKLEDPYNRSTVDLIEGMDCPRRVSEVLRIACDVEPERRYANLGLMLEALEEAIKEDPAKKWRFFEPPVYIWHEDRYRVYEVLRHACYGTLVAMLLIRPTLVQLVTIQLPDRSLPAIHLTDRPLISLLHAVIGGYVWAVLITGAFLLYQYVAFSERTRGYLYAGLFCGTGGFLGGVTASLLGILMSNACTLEHIKWLDIPATQTCEWTNDHNTPAWRLQGTLDTHMFWAFPLTGTLTGVGLGLSLNLRSRELIRKGIRHITPVPVKELRPGGKALWNSLAFSLRSPLSHLFLSCPLWLSFLAMPLLRWDELTLARSAGEGFVHYIGALGLSVGYFLGVAPPAKKVK